jgi:hypothetical protein
MHAVQPFLGQTDRQSLLTTFSGRLACKNQTALREEEEESIVQMCLRRYAFQGIAQAHAVSGTDATARVKFDSAGAEQAKDAHMHVSIWYSLESWNLRYSSCFFGVFLGDAALFFQL